MKFLSRFLVALVVTVMAHGFLATGAQAAKPSGPKSSSPKPSSADLSLSITESQDPWILGSEFDYVLTVSNRGPSSGSGTLDIKLSGGFVQWMTGTACTMITRRDLHCDLGSIPSGGRWGVRLRVDADALPDHVSTSMTVSGSVKGNQTDPDLSNNQRSESTTVVPWPVVRLPVDPYCPLGDDIIWVICMPWFDW